MVLPLTIRGNVSIILIQMTQLIINQLDGFICTGMHSWYE